MRAFLVLGLAVLLAGCFEDGSRENGRFQLAPLANGNGALILDTRDGDLWYWTKDANKTFFTFMGRATTQVIRYDRNGNRLTPTDEELIKKYGVPAPAK